MIWGEILGYVGSVELEFRQSSFGFISGTPILNMLDPSDFDFGSL